MAAKATAKVAGGVWVWDVDANSWWFAFRAAAATFRYISDITCDGAAQPGNPVLFPAALLPASAKFGVGAAGDPIGIVWPKWPCGFAGPLGSNADTEASGSSRVNPMNRFAAKYAADLIAGAVVRKVAPGGAAVAISTVRDPWHFRFPASRSAKLRNTIGFALSLHFGQRPMRNSHWMKACEVSGSFGSLRWEAASGGAPTAQLNLRAGWRAYLAPSFTRNRIAVPAAADAASIESALLNAPRLRLIVAKDMGPVAGELDCEISLSAEEAASDLEGDRSLGAVVASPRRATGGGRPPRPRRGSRLG